MQRSDAPDTWPLTVDKIVLHCDPLQARPGVLLVSFEADGETFALNGSARGVKDTYDMTDLSEVWAKDPATGYEMDVSALVQEGLKLCE